MNEEQLKSLIEEMIKDIDERSEQGELDRHTCQYIAEKYMRKVFGAKGYER
jgi:hypothetical protein